MSTYQTNAHTRTNRQRTEESSNLEDSARGNRVRISNGQTYLHTSAFALILNQVGFHIRDFGFLLEFYKLNRLQPQLSQCMLHCSMFVISRFPLAYYMDLE